MSKTLIYIFNSERRVSQLGLLRRLINFCRSQLSTPSHPEPADNDVIIRKIAVLSAQAVFKDIIPGYRIRALTDKEKAEKVSQMVQRTRDFEQGLVNVYQSYLQILETEVKGAFLQCDIYWKEGLIYICSQK